MRINFASAMYVYAFASVLVFSSCPLIYAIQFGVVSGAHWAGGVRLGFFTLVASLSFVFLSLGRLLYLACRKVIDTLVIRLESRNSMSPCSSRLGVSIAVLAGLVFIQAPAQVGRYFFVDAPATKLLAQPGALWDVVLVNCVVAPVVESAILVVAIELARRWLPSAAAIVVIAIAFGSIHGGFVHYWAIPAFVLFAYSAVIYVYEMPCAGRWRAALMILSIHAVNNFFGLALIVGKEVVVG